GGGQRGGAQLPASPPGWRPPPLQLRLPWPRSACLGLAQWRRRPSAPPGSKPKPCSPKCALNGGRSFGRSPKNSCGPALRAGPYVYDPPAPSGCEPDVDSPIAATDEQIIAGEFGLIAGELGRFWCVVTRPQRASQFFSQQLSPDYSAGALVPEISASSASESNLR